MNKYDLEELLDDLAQTMETEDGETLVIEVDDVKRLLEITKVQTELSMIDTLIATYQEWGSLDDRYQKDNLRLSRIKAEARLSKLKGGF